VERLDEIASKGDGRARVINKARVFELVRSAAGSEVVGVKYEKDGKTFTEYGPVVICTGGFGADFTKDSLLASIQEQWRTMAAWQTASRAGEQNKVNGLPFKVPPPLLELPTTNGPHCTGDGIKLAQGAGADVFDLHAVQVHPTGLVDPADPKNKVKFLAAEALRARVGGHHPQRRRRALLRRAGQARLRHDAHVAAAQGADSARAQRQVARADRVALRALRGAWTRPPSQSA